MTPPKRSRVAAKTHRLILSRFPTVGVFDDIAETEEELRFAFELEAATNPRLNPAVARLHRLPEGEVVHAEEGQGANIVMAAFLYTSDEGGRFNDPGLGAWYAALDLETAVAETVFHNERRLRASEAGFPNRLQLRELIAGVDIRVLDLRGGKETHKDLYRPDDYTASQGFSAARRWPFGEERAFAYDSVRREGGENIVLFRPRDVPLPVVQGGHLQYDWDRSGELTVSRLTGMEA